MHCISADLTLLLDVRQDTQKGHLLYPDCCTVGQMGMLLE